MTVMERIRSSTDSTVMKVIFVCIVLVFVFWGVGSGAGMMTTQPVATVNGKRITDTELQRIMRNRVRAMGGNTLDEDQVQALSKQVLEQLILDEALVQEAHRVGLEVSTEEMQRYVLEFDAFKDDEGEFSSELYARSLKRMGLTKGKFEEQIRDELLRNKLREVVMSGVDVSSAEVRDLYDRTATQATLGFVRISESTIASAVAIDDAAVESFLATSASKVTAAYEADKARLYSQPRRISYRRIVLRKGVAEVDDATARGKLEAIRAEAQGGADFEGLVRRWSEDLSAATGGASGLMPENQMDPQIANAAIAAGAGGLSDIVETERAFILLQVQEIVDATETPLDEVKHEIARKLLSQAEAQRLAGEWAEEILAAWKSGGAAPEALLAERGLELQAAGPFSPTDSFLPGIGVAPALLQAVTDQAGPGLIDAVFPIEGGRILAEVTDWSSADEAQYARIEPMIRYQLLQEKQGEVLQQWQEGLVSRAKVERMLR